MNDDLPAEDSALIRAGRDTLRELPDAPEWMVLRAQAVWRPRSLRTPPLVARLLAVLSFDSWAAPAPALRGSAEPGSRQWLFSAEGRDIDLRMAPAGNAWSIEGQVLGPDDGGLVEVECAGGAPLQKATIDDLGAFRLDGLVPGPCHVTLHFGATSVELPPLHLGPPPADD